MGSGHKSRSRSGELSTLINPTRALDLFFPSAHTRIPHSSPMCFSRQLSCIIKMRGAGTIFVLYTNALCIIFKLISAAKCGQELRLTALLERSGDL